MASYQSAHHRPVDHDNYLYERRPSYHRTRPRSHSPAYVAAPLDQRPVLDAPEWRHRTKWPPSPSVEDEDISLAREKSPPSAHHADQEVPSRGSVDQVPIMDYTGAPPQEQYHRSESENSSRDGSGGETPLTSQSHNDERRFVLLPNDKPANSASRSSHEKTKESASVANDSRANRRVDPALHNPAPRPANSGDTPPSKPTSSQPARDNLPDPSTSYANTFGRTPPLQYAARPASTSRAAAGATGQTSQVDHTRSLNIPNGSRSHHRPNNASEDHLDLHNFSDSNSASRASSASRSDQRSQYSFTAADLKHIDQSLEQSTDSRPTNVSVQPMKFSSNHDHLSAPGSRYDDQRHLSSSTPSSSHLPPDMTRRPRSARSSRGPSPSQSPCATPPLSPGREYGRYDWGSSPAQNSRGRTPPRPTTPSPRSPPHAASFPSTKDASSRSPAPLPQLPPRASTNPHGSSTLLQPNSTATNNLQPQMVEIKKDASGKPFTLRSRQTSPIPPPLSTTSVPRQAGSFFSDIPQSAPPSKYSFQSMNDSRPRSRDSTTGQDTRAAQRPSPSPQPATAMPDPSDFDKERPSRSSENYKRQSLPAGNPTHRSRSARPNELPVLPPCPRPLFMSRYDDWCTLPGHPNFDICPTCRKGLEDAGSAAKFIPSPKRPEKYATKCDMSTPWVRMAWLLLLQSRPTHPTVVDQITTTQAKESPCPGKQLAPRSWYGLYDSDSSKFLPNFDACPACTRQLEALFPNLKGKLQKPSSNPTGLRTCDLRVDSVRFTRYLDLLDSISKHAYEQRREPNMARFTTLARQLTSVRECQQDDQLLDQAWHFMPELPDFTVCEECYRDQVWPLIQQNLEVANRFNRRPDYPPQGRVPISCQLYSPRMREVWKESCRSASFERLRSAAVQRVAKERDLQARHLHIKSWPEEQQMAEGTRLVSEWRKWA